MRLGLGIALSLTPLVGQRVTTLQFSDDTSVTQVWYEDLSGDGIRDLIVAVAVRGRDYARSLRIHYANPETATFSQTPDIIATVPRSIAAAAIGDLHGDAGAEVIWFGHRGVYVWRPRAKVQDREQKLVACDFLFQYPHPKQLHSWQVGVRDLNGDGLTDLLLPEPSGYRVAIQRRDDKGLARFRVSTLRIPSTPPKKQSDVGGPIRGRRTGSRFNIGLDIGSSEMLPPAPLVTIDEQVAAPQVHDWDGDGDFDILAKQGERVFVWLQGQDGVFGTAPDLVLQFPINDDQTRLDPRFSASLVDFNQDRRVDAVLVAKDRNATELRTQIMFFPQQDGATPLFAKGVPSQLLILAGFTSPPTFTDVDGDGKVDLHINSWRLDVMNQITSGGKQSLDIEIYVYLNRGGRFSRRPDMIHRETLDGGVLRSAGDRLSARFLGDVTGDRVSDLLVRDRSERVRMMMVKRRGDTLSILPKPIWEMRISPKARIQYLTGKPKRPGFLVLERNQVLLVRF